MPEIPTPAAQRQGITSYLVVTPEDNWDSVVIATPAPFIFPLSDRSGYRTTQGLEEAPIFTGTALPPAVVDMNVEAGGALPAGLEYTALARMLALAFGSNGYLRDNKTHEYFIPITPGSKQKSYALTRIWPEATARYVRSTGNKTASVEFPFATAGRAGYTITAMGSGRSFDTNGAGTVTDDGYVPASYFNMQMVVNDKVSVGLTNFSDTLNFNLSRQDVAANSGYAGGINEGFVSAGGSLGMTFAVDGTNIESNFNLRDLATNKTEFAIDCIYTDLPLDSATQWFRRRYWVRIERFDPEVGGTAGVTQEGNWRMTRSANAKWAAERYNDIAASSFTLGATPALGIKIDGGATIVVSLTAGVQTVDQIVAALNAAGPFAAVAVADKFAGRIRITSKTKGTASSVQIDTATVNSQHVVLGFTGVAKTGKANAPLLYEIYNNTAANLI